MTSLTHESKKSLSARLHTTLLWLYQNQELWESDLETALKLVTRTASQILNVGIAGVWEYHPSGYEMLCRLQYSAASDSYDTPSAIERSLYPAYFQALEAGRVISANDAINDRRTCEFAESYLIPKNIRSMLDATLRQAGKTCGMFCLEHLATLRLWSREEQEFATSIADLVSQLLIFYRLTESDTRHRALFDSARDAIVVFKDGVFIDCNKSAEDVFNLPRHHIIGSSPGELSPRFQEDGRPSDIAAKEKIIAAMAGAPQFFNWWHKRGDGRTFEAEVSIERIKMGPDFCLQAIVRDVTARNRVDRAIRMIAQGVSARGDVSFFEQMVTHLAQNFEAKCAMIAQLDPLNPLQLKTVAINLRSQLVPNFVHALPGSAFEHLLAEGGCLIGEHARSIFPDDTLLSVFHAESFLGMPFFDSAGQALGFVAVIDSKSIETDVQHKEILEIFAARAGSELERLAVQEKLHHAADNDSLTGLPNRRKLHEVAAEAVAALDLASEHRPVLFLLDLDRFKEVNDTLGHHTGDQLLIQVGLRLQETLKSHNALLCRLGGDEFAVFTNDINGAEQAKALAQKITRALSQPFTVGEIALSLGSSLGIALYPEHGDNSHALLRCADVAMYHAKKGGGGYAVYDASLDAHSPRRLRMMTDLGNAIHEGQMELHYQPKIDVESGQCIGCEALARWEHPHLGAIAPTEFIPLAEMSDLIHPLSLHVAAAALEQLSDWDARGLYLSVAINISARNLLDLNFAENLSQIIEAKGIAAERLEIEITESALISDPERAMAIISRISAMGVKFSIDDFGTGYSSLSYLKRLPIDALKIDRSFVQDMLLNEQDAIIVRSTVSLAHNLGLKVVAEGVENQRTLEHLGQLGCDMAQGFQICKALPAQQFERWIRRQSHSWEPSLG